MAMFTVYLDASGAPDNTQAITVAGLVSTASKWIRFERKWKACLSDYGVSALHMKDFAHSRREFSAWKGDEGKRKKFLGRLIRIMKSQVVTSVVSSVTMEDYRTVDAKFDLTAQFYPYALVGLSCIISARKWAEKNNLNPADILFIFEKGDKDADNLRRISEERLEVTPLFWEKEKSVAFEASDLLAYEHLQLMKRLETVPSGKMLPFKKMRGSLQKMMADSFGAENWKVHDEEGLTALCEKWKVTRRDQPPQVP